MLDKSFQALVLSIAIHCLLVILFFQWPAPSGLESQNETVEVEFIDEQRAQQIVTQTQVNQDQLVDRLKKQASYLSKLRQRVEKEMIASKQGDRTQNRQQQRQGKSGDSEGREASRPLNLKPSVQFGPKTAGNKPKKSKRTSRPRVGGVGAGRSVMIGDSSISDHVPGIERGHFTALDTDQFLYYSFFERVKDALRFRWISRVRQFSQQAPASLINQLAQAPSPTHVRVILNKKGELLRTKIFKSSGSNELDDAAVQAFVAAAPLKNPPLELLDQKNEIKLDFGFMVRWRPRRVAHQNGG